jgi:nicotinate-nucleotide--dimethylbenzimidazole phosphoribosyltransferase
MKPEELIARTLNQIGELDQAAMEFARLRQLSLTKPAGSLGRLEELSLKMAGIQGRPDPQVRHKAIVVMAADHGVASEGVSAYPQVVTAQMVRNHLAGGAGISVLSRHAGAQLIEVDLGVAADLPFHPNLISHKIAWGTQNITQGPAMQRHEALEAIATGIEVVQMLAAQPTGLDLVGTGEKGIGNTTPSSAIVAAITGFSVENLTGRGTGITDEGLRHKIAVVERALEVNRPDPNDPLDVLTKVGGLEIAGLVGLIFGAAASRIAIMVDGFISTAAALIATEWCPAVRHYLIASHRSVEIGHQVMLERMELSPLLNLNLRLGEGSGAALAMNLVEAAVKVLNEMATFGEAGVSHSEQNLAGIKGQEVTNEAETC